MPDIVRFCTSLCRNTFYSKELMLQEEMADIEILEKWLSTRKRQVYIRVPKKSKENWWNWRHKMHLVLSRDKSESKRRRTYDWCCSEVLLYDLESVNRMEAFDISNISGC